MPVHCAVNMPIRIAMFQYVSEHQCANEDDSVNLCPKLVAMAMSLELLEKEGQIHDA